MDKENQNGKIKQSKHFEDATDSEFEPINNCRNSPSHLRPSSHEHIVFDVDVINENLKHKEDDSESEGHFSSPEFGVSALQSPEPSTLAHFAGYDPKRIPTSIFSTKPQTPMDWSVASNESLFSIHLGNSSFSKENFLLLYKSGELAKQDDQPVQPAKPDEPTKLSKHDEPSIGKKPDESIYFQSSPSLVTKTDNVDKIVGSNEVHHRQQKVPAEYAVDNSIRSEGSNTSTASLMSFAFPVFENDAGKNTSLNMEIMKEDLEKRSFTWQYEAQQNEQQSQEQLRPQTPGKTPRFGSNNWLSCIPCLSPRGFKKEVK